MKLIFTGSPVDALGRGPRKVGNVGIYQTEEIHPYRCSEVTYAGVGALPVQHTVVHALWTRPGQLLMIAETALTVPAEDVDLAVRRAFETAERARALTAAVLDERIVDRRLGEFTTVDIPGGTAVLDVTRAVRTFDPFAEKTYDTTGALNAPADVDLSPDNMGGPLALYLHAVERRYTAEGFLLLATVVDELADAGAFKAHKVHVALQQAGLQTPLAALEKVSTTRGRLIHNGTRALLDH